MADIQYYVNDLIKSLEDSDKYVRASSVRALGELKTKIPPGLRT